MSSGKVMAAVDCRADGTGNVLRVEPAFQSVVGAMFAAVSRQFWVCREVMQWTDAISCHGLYRVMEWGDMNWDLMMMITRVPRAYNLNKSRNLPARSVSGLPGQQFGLQGWSCNLLLLETSAEPTAVLQER